MGISIIRVARKGKVSGYTMLAKYLMNCFIHTEYGISNTYRNDLITLNKTLSESNDPVKTKNNIENAIIKLFSSYFNESVSIEPEVTIEYASANNDSVVVFSVIISLIIDGKALKVKSSNNINYDNKYRLMMER